METYYITSSGRLEKEGDALKFSNSEGSDTIPLEAVSNIIVSGNVTITKAAVSLISGKNIPLFYMSFYGNYISSLLPEDYLISGTVIRKQVIASSEMNTRLVIARSFVLGAARNMALVARRSGMGKLDIRKSSIEESQEINSLMGVEGNIRSEYFELMDGVLPEPFRIGKRVRRPPNNRSNSLIGFLNSILYAQVASQIFSTHLHPAVSFLHEPFERRTSLSLDVAEIFKPIICDRVLLKLVRLKVIKEEDFENSGVFLTETGRKKVLKELDDRMNETVYSSNLRRYISYKHLIKLELYKLERHILGEKQYKPFIARS